MASLNITFPQQIWNTLWSAGLLALLLKNRDQLTPDFFHFITCVVEEEGHHLCVFAYWATYKCFLLDPLSFGVETGSQIARGTSEKR